MAVDIAQLGISVRSDGVLVATKNLDQLEKSSKRAETANDRLSRSAERMGRTLGRITAIGVTAMAGLTVNSIRLAISAEETASKFQVVFRGSVERANAQLVEMMKTIPLTITQMRGLASGVQDMLVPMGLVREEAADLSVQAVQLAGDIASFNDTNADVVLQNIQSALAGSSEPLRKYGVDVREARLQAIALEKGLIGVGDELDSAARAQAVFIAITQDSSDAMGDAERTMGSTANQLRFMRRNFVQAQEDLGQALIPAFNELLTSLNAVDDEGMSPLMTTMQSISSVILNVVKGVFLLSAGWKILKNRIQELLTLVPDGGADLFSGLITQDHNKIASGLQRIFKTDLPKHLEDAKAERVALAAELEAVLEPILATISGIDGALGQLGAGVNRTLEDTRAGMDGISEAAEGMAEAYDTEALAELLHLLDPTVQATKDLADARKLLEAARVDLGEEQYERLIRLLNRSELAFKAVGEAAFKLRKMNPQVAAELAESFAFLDDLENLQREFNGLLRVLDPVAAHLQDVADARELLNEAFEAGLIDRAEFDHLAEAIENMGDAMVSAADRFRNSTQLLAFAFDSLARSAEEGSRTQRTFAIAAEVANAVLAIQAVLNQASGEPYSAFARMAAMAGIVASLGYNVGSMSGGGSHANVSADRQATQGTGSVLGDAAAKSESILKASEITADATSELVGINRGMLHALQALQDGIQGAVVQLARGAGGADFGGLPSTFNTTLLHGDILGKSLLGKLIDSIFGGSSKLVDEGIAILGGSIDEIIIQAFRTVSVKKHIFSGTKITDEFQDLGEEINSQFQLVFDSIETTVTEAALALGIPLDVIQARIESFEVAAQQISLMDLSAEEQRAELLAVFGSIFDDLAAHVIPFIDQFQKVGEGLGETLVRVATSVQVFEEAVQSLGFAADMSDPEAVAQMAVGLVDLAGGVSEFISQFSAFMDKFASDEQKLAFATDQLARAFDDVGLVIPETREGMWDLMRSMDASTEAGREQIATILRLANVADEYYKLLEDSALRSIRAFADADFAADYQRMVQLQGEAPTATLTRLARELFDAVAAFDNTPGSLAEIANGFSDVQQAGINAVSSIDAAWKGLTATIDRLRQDTLDIIAGPKSEREIFVDAAGLVDQARTAQTPEELTRLVAQFDSLIRQLTPETAQRLGGNLIDLIDRFQSAADTSFERVRDQTLNAIASMQTMADAFLTSIPDALALVASTNERAAMALEAIAGVEGSVPSIPGVSSPVDTTAITNVLGASSANQEQILLTGTTMMADALRSGTANLQQNIATAIQSGFGNARVEVHVHIADNGLATQ